MRRAGSARRRLDHCKAGRRGLDGARLCAIAARLKATDANVHGVVIVRGGKLVFEQYFAGYDSPGAAPTDATNSTPRHVHDMRSVTKSVMSLLLGIALDRKLIASLDEPVMKFFPEYAEVKTPGWEKITLRHLVKMSSGLQWDENLPWNAKNDEWHLVNDADPLRYVFQKPFAFPPDTVWTYNGGGTDLLGKVIEKSVGQCRSTPLPAKRCFEPLGITDWKLMNYRNGKHGDGRGPAPAPARCRKDRPARAQQGRAGTAGRSSPPSGSRTRSSRAFRRSACSAACSTTAISGGSAARFAGDQDVTWIAGQGLGGQRLIIVPDLDLVVMVTQGLYPSGRQGHAALDILANFVVPAVRDRTHAEDPRRESIDHDLALHRRRHDHPSHHRAGGPVPARARHDRRTDAGTAGGEPPAGCSRRRSTPTTCCSSASSPTSCKTPHHTILVDSCLGNDKPRPGRPAWNMKTDDTYMRALAAAGLSVDDIDYVMCTHLHVDHVGWNTRLENGRWVPTFPKARYVFGKQELRLLDGGEREEGKPGLSSTACCRSSRRAAPRP